MMQSKPKSYYNRDSNRGSLQYNLKKDYPHMYCHIVKTNTIIYS